MSGYMKCPLVPLSSGGQSATSLRQTGQLHLRYQPSLCLALQSPKPQGKRRVTHCTGRQSFPALCTRLLRPSRDRFVQAERPSHDNGSVTCPKSSAPLNIHLDGLQHVAVVWIATHRWLTVGGLNGPEESYKAAP